MMSVSVSADRPEHVAEAIRVGTREALWQAVRAGFEVSQELVPVDTGELKASGSIIETDEGVTFGYDADHAIPVEGGTDPHTIEGDPLAFQWPEATGTELMDQFEQARDAAGRFAEGAQVFFQSVEHPGTDAQPFVQPGFEAMAAELRRRGISPSITAELGGT